MSEQKCNKCGKKILGSSYRIVDGKHEEYTKKTCSSCERAVNPIYKYETEDRLLSDGIYDVSGLEVMFFRDMNWTDPDKLEAHVGVKSFMERHPDYVVAQAYQATTLFLVQSKPEEITKKVWAAGETFNYGSCNMLTDLPDSILILAEDD